MCSALEHFSLPAALCSLGDDAFVAWNDAFQKSTRLSQAQLAEMPFSSLIRIADGYGEGDSESMVGFVPCVLKNALLNEWMPEHALRRSDGMMVMMLNLPVGGVAFEGFLHGLLVGREEERNRTREFFHGILSSKILIASFIAHEVSQALAASGVEGSKGLERVTKLLHEVIDEISSSFNEEVLDSTKQSTENNSNCDLPATGGLYSR